MLDIILLHIFFLFFPYKKKLIKKGIWLSLMYLDPETKAWLANHKHSVFGFPSVVRFSWGTCTSYYKDMVEVSWYCTNTQIPLFFNTSTVPHNCPCCLHNICHVNMHSCALIKNIVKNQNTPIYLFITKKKKRIRQFLVLYKC